MSNRATLINKAEAIYSDADVDTGFLATKHSIGVLWPALFRIEDLRYFEGTDAESGDSFRVPYLVTSTAAARQNWNLRKPLILKTLSPVGLAAVEQFEAAMSHLKEAFIVLDTWEVWMMDPDGLDLKACIEEISRGDISQLKEQASIRDGNEEMQQYMGFPWQ